MKKYIVPASICLILVVVVAYFATQNGVNLLGAMPIPPDPPLPPIPPTP